MALLARIFVVFFGFLLACVAAAMVVAVAVELPLWDELVERPPGHQGIAVMVALSAVFFAIYAMLPAMLLVALAEGFRLRSVLFYALAGGALALCSAYGFDLRSLRAGASPRGAEIMATAGIVGGLVYWALAGRNAGKWRRSVDAARAAPSVRTPE
jgi:uncharacterized protein (DUF983 family)